MHRDLKFNIISEGIRNGVSPTCKKYNISRTIYYKWLKRYKAEGIEGLNDIKRHFTPSNKISSEVEKVLLKLIRTYRRYGPRAIKYLLDEVGYHISESAVFNVMKRNNLTNKESRIFFAKKKELPIDLTLPPLKSMESGDCWIFWITDYGSFDKVGQLYEYTFYDYKSRIACTRLYNALSYLNFEDLLTAVAIPVAQSLSLSTKYLCFFQDGLVIGQAKNIFKSKISRTIKDSGFDVTLHVLEAPNHIQETTQLKNHYTEECLSFIMPLIKKGLTFSDIKLEFQHYVRHYNIGHKMTYDNLLCSPVEYHNQLTNTKLILPLWAYIDRAY